MIKSFLSALVVILFCSISFSQENQYNTNINISSANFKMIKPNLTGKAYGGFFLFFGATPNKSQAISNLVQEANIPSGTSRCVANVNVNRKYIFFLIGAIIIDEARGDLIEYQKNREDRQ